jgi:DMSO/TMAO reductase YedYZ molybdopterin-dependent catalytic subunit
VASTLVAEFMELEFYSPGLLNDQYRTPDSTRIEVLFLVQDPQGKPKIFPSRGLRLGRHSGISVSLLDRRLFFSVLTAGYIGSANISRADHHVVSADPFEVEVDLISTSSRYTSLDDFYIRDHFRVPPRPAAHIEIAGAVERPVRVDNRALAALKRIELGAVLECAGDPVSTNALASNGLWGGWRLADVLALAQPSRTSTHVLLYGCDGYSRVVPMSRLAEDAMVVSDLNGLPLRRNHGAPWRVFFPGWYGMDSVKWLERIVVATEAPPEESYSYHQITRDVSGLHIKPLPRVQIKSVITSPRPGMSLHAGNIEVNGLAWSGKGRVEFIELSADSGTKWQTVPFDKRPRYEWAIWKTSVEVERGATELIVRAHDESGQSQPQNPDAGRIDRYANNWLHRVRIAVI